MIQHYFKFAQNVIYYREKARRRRYAYESMEAYVADQQWNWNRSIVNEQYVIDYATRLIERLEWEAKRSSNLLSVHHPILLQPVM